MANYHLEVLTISRRKHSSVTRVVSYICGRTLHDSYNGRTYHNHRKDVVWQKIFLPGNAPAEFRNIQHLCNKVDEVEKRKDARTARQFIGSLPNELPPGELVRIVHEFIENNFVSYGLCAIAAIHRGLNRADKSRNNPHVHILVLTRTVGPGGFSEKKDREHDKRKYIRTWREQWAEVQNRAYERNRLDIQVSHKSLKVQGKCDREPTRHLSLADWQREKRGERTFAGDRQRAIEVHNRERQRQLEEERSLDIER